MIDFDGARATWLRSESSERGECVRVPYLGHDELLTICALGTQTPYFHRRVETANAQCRDTGKLFRATRSFAAGRCEFTSRIEINCLSAKLVLMQSLSLVATKVKGELGRIADHGRGSQIIGKRTLTPA